MKQIKIKKLNKDAKIPTRGSEYAADYLLNYLKIHLEQFLKEVD